MLNKILLTGIVAFSLCTSAALAGSGGARAGIDAYNSKQYAKALPLLEMATASAPKDESAHYYLALTYQALGRMGDAEREYKWNYTNGKDSALKYKAWQGLSALQASKGRRTSSGVAMEQAQKVDPTLAAASSGGVKLMKAGSSPYKPEKGTTPIVESGFVRGCFKH